MVFNATFNNISVISWRSLLLVEETGVPGEKHRPVPSHFVGSNTGKVKPMTIKLVFDDSPLSMHHEGATAVTGWLGIRIMQWSDMSTCRLLLHWATSMKI
jgi:hypothetical protein